MRVFMRTKEHIITCRQTALIMQPAHAGHAKLVQGTCRCEFGGVGQRVAGVGMGGLQLLPQVRLSPAHNVIHRSSGLQLPPKREWALMPHLQTAASCSWWSQSCNKATAIWHGPVHMATCAYGKHSDIHRCTMKSWFSGEAGRTWLCGSL